MSPQDSKTSLLSKAPHLLSFRPSPATITDASCLVADHEIVDVDGFVFKRKRRTPLTDSMNLPAAQAKRAKPSAELEVGDTLCSLWAEGPSDFFFQRDMKCVHI